MYVCYLVRVDAEVCVQLLRLPRVLHLNCIGEVAVIVSGAQARLTTRERRDAARARARAHARFSYRYTRPHGPEWARKIECPRALIFLIQFDKSIRIGEMSCVPLKTTIGPNPEKLENSR